MSGNALHSLISSKTKEEVEYILFSPNQYSICSENNADIDDDSSPLKIRWRLVRNSLVMSQRHHNKDRPPFVRVRKSVVAFKDVVAQTKYYENHGNETNNTISHTCDVPTWASLPYKGPRNAGKIGLFSSKVSSPGDSWHSVVVVQTHDNGRDKVWIYDPYLERRFQRKRKGPCQANARLKSIPGLRTVTDWVAKHTERRRQVWIAGGGWYEGQRLYQRLSLLAIAYAAAILASRDLDIHEDWGRQGSILTGPRTGRWMRLGYDWTKVTL